MTPHLGRSKLCSIGRDSDEFRLARVPPDHERGVRFAVAGSPGAMSRFRSNDMTAGTGTSSSRSGRRGDLFVLTAVRDPAQIAAMPRSASIMAKPAVFPSARCSTSAPLLTMITIPKKPRHAMWT